MLLALLSELLRVGGMDFEPRPRVLSFSQLVEPVDEDNPKSPNRRTSTSSEASGKPPSRRGSQKPGESYVSPYRLWRRLSDTIQEKSLTCRDYDRKQPIQNTYRTEPKRKFPEGEVREIIKNSLEGMLSEQTYSAKECGFLTKLLSSRIIEQVKSLNIERYKLVCLVNVGSKHNQGLMVASRCLWNAEYDTHVTAIAENGTLFAVATVYAVYFE